MPGCRRPKANLYIPLPLGWWKPGKYFPPQHVLAHIMTPPLVHSSAHAWCCNAAVVTPRSLITMNRAGIFTTLAPTAASRPEKKPPQRAPSAYSWSNARTIIPTRRGNGWTAQHSSQGIALGSECVWHGTTDLMGRSGLVCRPFWSLQRHGTRALIA